MANDDKPGTVRAYGYQVKPDGSIEFHPGVPDDVQAKILAERAAQADYHTRRRAVWGAIGPESMTRLVRHFPSLRDARGVAPWDAMEFLTWLSTSCPSDESYWAALLVLGVWNDTDWREAALEAHDKKKCRHCQGVGKDDAETGDPIRPGSKPGSYVRTGFDDDDRQLDVPASPRACQACDGKGFYIPAPGHPRFNLFEALKVWDEKHREALQLFTAYPFWP